MVAEEEVAGTSPDCEGQHEAHQSVIEQQFGAALLKLEYLVHVPGTSIDKFLQELNYSISSASVTFSRGFVSDILERHSLQVNEQVVTEITKAVCLSNPVQGAIKKGGPLSTSYLCK